MNCPKQDSGLTFWYLRQRHYGAVRVTDNGNAWEAGVHRNLRTTFPTLEEARATRSRLLVGRNPDFCRTMIVVRVTEDGNSIETEIEPAE